MRRLVKTALSGLAALVLVLSAVPAVSVSAASTVTIKFRAGNVGTFDTEKLASYGITDATANYFEISAAKSTSVQVALNEATSVDMVGEEAIYNFFNDVVVTDSTYALVQVSEWCEELTEGVKHNEDYTLDYAVISNPVKYTVYYVDEELNLDNQRAQIYAASVRYGSAGETITVTAPLINEYETETASQSITLVAGEENSITFVYSYTGITYVPGETIYNTVYNDVPTYVTENVTNGDNGAAAGNAAADNGAAGANDNGANDNGEAGANGEAGENGENGEDVTDVEPETTIADDDTPLSDGTTIEDEETPKAAGQQKNNLMATCIIAGSATGLVIIAGLATFFLIKNKKKAQAVSSGEEEKSQGEDK